MRNLPKFPISTSYENNEPRLLLVSVDVKKEASLYLIVTKKRIVSGKLNMVSMVLNTLEDLMTRKDNMLLTMMRGLKLTFTCKWIGTVNYEYTKLQVENTSRGYQNKMKNEEQKGDGNHLTTSRVRYFWDGGIITKYSRLGGPL
ncbi:MAG: hypothetical protein P0116_14765 [Candidatus Nitrosocosmicus sp.]|nr:hypothetical protein [Candidatus Nitrosocosmicus sp.]